jgi:hypothetical protein
MQQMTGRCRVRILFQVRLIAPVITWGKVVVLMRFIASYFICMLASTTLATLAGGCISSEPSTANQENVSSTEQAISSDGPFTSTQDLINYWTSTSTSGALAQIYLNGRKVYERSGFGPAFVKQYFACSSGGILAVCTSGFFDGYTNFNTLVSRCPADAAIYKDGVLFRSGTNQAVADVSTCSGDQSFYGVIRYYKVIDFDQFVPYHSSCYP